MQTSTYFQRTLFYDQSPATEEYFLRVSEKLFEDDEKGSRMEARIFEHHDEAHSETPCDAVKNPQLLQESGTSIEGEKKYTYAEQRAYGTEPLALSLESTPDNVSYDTDSTTGPAPAIDQHSPIRLSPPGYVSRARLISHNITNRHTLRDLVAVRRAWTPAPHYGWLKLSFLENQTHFSSLVGCVTIIVIISNKQSTVSSVSGHLTAAFKLPNRSLTRFLLAATYFLGSRNLWLDLVLDIVSRKLVHLGSSLVHYILGKIRNVMVSVCRFPHFTASHQAKS